MEALAFGTFLDPRLSLPCPKNPCVFPNNTILAICEMLDNSECKCFAFDSNDGIHWSALGLGFVILALLAYIFYIHRQKKKKSKQHERYTGLLPLQEVLPQPSKS